MVPLLKKAVEFMDVSSQPQAAPQGMGNRPAVEDITTRFGKVTINRANSMFLPKGILGMPDKCHFCLTDFPLTKLQQFRLLQSATDDELAFVVLPVELKNEYVDEKDIEDACRTLALTKKDLGLLLIVSVHRRVNSVNLSVNVRAPLFIDTVKKTAVQYVLPNNKYEIRHMLNIAAMK